MGLFDALSSVLCFSSSSIDLNGPTAISWRASLSLRVATNDGDGRELLSIEALSHMTFSQSIFLVDEESLLYERPPGLEYLRSGECCLVFLFGRPAAAAACANVLLYSIFSSLLGELDVLSSP